MKRRIAWQPFAGKGMTVAETRYQIRWAMRQWGLFCGVVFESSSDRPHFTVRPYNDNKYAGYYDGGKNIYISTVRNMAARNGHVLGGIVMHELGHAIGLRHNPSSDVMDKRDWLMHPWGSNQDWPSPDEVVTLQKRFGQSGQRYYAWPLAVVGRKVQDAKKDFQAARKKMFEYAAKRDELTKPTDRQAQHAKVLQWRNISLSRWTRLKKLNTQWHAIADQWRGTPGAIVPPSTLGASATELRVASTDPYEITRNGIACGCDDAPKLSDFVPDERLEAV